MLGWLLIPAGVAMMVYTRDVGDMLGDMPIADKFGGIYSFVRFLGLLAIVLGFMIGTGAFGSLFMSFFGPIFGQ